MPFKKQEELRKGELTSMIDVIFLLLIFFLVTLAAGIKPQEAANVGIPEKPKSRPVVKSANPDSVFSLKISVNRYEDDSLQETQGLRFQMYFLDDSMFTSDLEVDEKLPKRLQEIEELLRNPEIGYAERLELETERTILDSFFTPITLPSKETYRRNRSEFIEQYSPVTNRVGKWIDRLIEQQAEMQTPERIKIFLDVDEDIYYKLIADINDVYYSKEPNKAINITSQDNLFINVNFSGSN